MINSVFADGEDGLKFVGEFREDATRGEAGEGDVAKTNASVDTSIGAMTWS